MPQGYMCRSYLYLSTVLGLFENPITGTAARPVSERPIKWALSPLCFWRSEVFCDLHVTWKVICCKSLRLKWWLLIDFKRILLIILKTPIFSKVRVYMFVPRLWNVVTVYILPEVRNYRYMQWSDASLFLQPLPFLALSTLPVDN